MSVVCDHVKTCGVRLAGFDKDKKTIPAGCNHASPHEYEWRCNNGVCMRIAPATRKCVAVEELEKQEKGAAVNI